MSSTPQLTMIVTGGSAGIGLAIVQRLIADGFHVCNLDIVPSPHGQYVHCDMRNLSQVRQQISQLCEQYNVYGLVANAGMHLSATIEDTSEAQFDEVFDLNVKGTYAAVQAVLPSLKIKRNGVILAVASDQSVIAKPNSFIYNLSKHALASLVKTTALDFAAYNIRANALCPGTTDTPLYQAAIAKYCARTGADADAIHAEEAALQPLNRIATAQEVAAYAAFLVSPEASFITGSLAMIDGGYTAQ